VYEAEARARDEAGRGTFAPTASVVGCVAAPPSVSRPVDASCSTVGRSLEGAGRG
jgi:hypothetical protein